MSSGLVPNRELVKHGIRAAQWVGCSTRRLIQGNEDGDGGEVHQQIDRIHGLGNGGGVRVLHPEPALHRWGWVGLAHLGDELDDVVQLSKVAACDDHGFSERSPEEWGPFCGGGC